MIIMRREKVQRKISEGRSLNRLNGKIAETLKGSPQGEGFSLKKGAIKNTGFALILLKMQPPSLLCWVLAFRFSTSFYSRILNL